MKNVEIPLVCCEWRCDDARWLTQSDDTRKSAALDMDIEAVNTPEGRGTAIYISQYMKYALPQRAREHLHTHRHGSAASKCQIDKDLLEHRNLFISDSWSTCRVLRALFASLNTATWVFNRMSVELARRNFKSARRKTQQQQQQSCAGCEQPICIVEDNFCYLVQFGCFCCCYLLCSNVVGFSSLVVCCRSVFDCSLFVRWCVFTLSLSLFHAEFYLIAEFVHVLFISFCVPVNVTR